MSRGGANVARLTRRFGNDQGDNKEETEHDELRVDTVQVVLRVGLMSSVHFCHRMRGLAHLGQDLETNGIEQLTQTKR